MVWGLEKKLGKGLDELVYVSTISRMSPFALLPNELRNAENSFIQATELLTF